MEKEDNLKRENYETTAILELNKIDILDGFLIGGACLEPDKFIKIIETIN